jgi:NAD(P)H-dependent FMN reductase
MNIEIIAGSPRQGSVTLRVALFLQKQFKEKTEHNIGLINMQDYNLPFVQNVWSSVDKAPDEFKELAGRMFAANAFVIVTPEYNGSYSPAMKNLFDHFPKQMHKAFGLAPASDGAMGGIRASQQLQLLVNGLFGICSPAMMVTPRMHEKFDAEGNLLDGTFQNNVSTFMTEFLWLAERLVK